MSRFCSLFSSSSGNSTYVAAKRDGILIDAGVSAKKIGLALTNRDIDPQTIKAIFVTHEHSDHINGIRVFASKYNTPVYATKGTLKQMDEKCVLNGKFPYFELNDKPVEVGDMLVRNFATPHDSAQSCGFTIEMPDERKIAIATDIGHVTDEIVKNLIGCDLVMLESNHDVGMLQNGEYPYMLKRRVLSDVGHLSNENCAILAAKLVENNTTRLFLAHLSEQNNLPRLAYQASMFEMQKINAVLGRDFLLEVNSPENQDGIVRF